MKKTLSTTLICAAMVLSGVALAAPVSQYNMSLEDKIAVGHNGAHAHPHAVNMDILGQIEKKAITKVTEGVYRISGWGIANTVAVEGPEGWVIVDAGDSLEMATEQRQYLEAKVGKIKVAGLLYTHSHYIAGAKAFVDEGTEVYAHEDLMDNLNDEQGVSPITGNFARRATSQFGMFHPKEGPDAFPNNAGFGLEKLTGTKAVVTPTITFKDGEIEHYTIGGVSVEVLPSKTDVYDSVAFYFPETKVLASNALGSNIIYNLYTLRGDRYRDPATFIEAADLALARDIEHQIDIHGPYSSGKENVVASLQQARDWVQLMLDQTYRAISLGMDGQEAAEWIYMPNREGYETYGQVESHVKQIYSARVGWMGNDPYDINPLSKENFSSHIIEGMGGFDSVLKAAQASNEKETFEGWQWSLYLTSELMISDANNENVKAVRAEAARALGQRTTSANARGWYITEARVLEGKIKFGEHTVSDMRQLNPVLGAITPAKLAESSLKANVQYLRYMVDTRLAEGKRAMFNVNFKEEGQSYAIALRNGVIAITDQPNEGRTIDLTKGEWDQLITGDKSFGSLHRSLKDFDKAIVR